MERCRLQSWPRAELVNGPGSVVRAHAVIYAAVTGGASLNTCLGAIIRAPIAANDEEQTT